MKIVINRCYGGFSLSDECAAACGARIVRSEGGWTYHDWASEGADELWTSDSDQRTNPKLIELMETKGSEWCSGHLSALKVVEIPDDVEWEIDEYDGIETIEEVHRVWY